MNVGHMRTLTGEHVASDPKHNIGANKMSAERFGCGGVRPMGFSNT